MTAAADTSHRDAIAGLVDVIGPLLLEAEAEFNDLDRAIGDGDHGSNLARAARGLMEARDELAELPVGEALSAAGRSIVMNVGGASGPLYGTLLMEMGRVLPAHPARSDWAVAFTQGVEGVARRGRSAEGNKTMLDVLAPAARALSENAARDWDQTLPAMREAALEGFSAQRGLRARSGRAAYVGERSIGKDDPGATSALRCICAVADHLNGKQQ